MTSDEIQTVLDTEAYLMIEEAVWKLFKELQSLGFTHTDTVERVCNYVTGVQSAVLWRDLFVEKHQV